MDAQEKYQIREIAKMMATPGWAFLLAAWAQKREGKILGHLKRSRAEAHWRFHQGRLDGFDEAVTLPETLASQLEAIQEDQTSETERLRIVAELSGGQK